MPESAIQLAVSEPGYPVTVAVERADGRVEQVRIGTAFKSGDGFTLKIGDLSVGPSAVADDRAAPRATPVAAPYSGGGMALPNYGRSKGAPVAGASMQDLEYYANGCRRTLADPAKARWHDKERTLLAAIEAEIVQQRGGVEPMASRDEPPPLGDDDIPF